MPNDDDDDDDDDVNVMLFHLRDFCERRLREGHTFLMGVYETAFTRVP